MWGLWWTNLHLLRFATKFVYHKICEASEDIFLTLTHTSRPTGPEIFLLTFSCKTFIHEQGSIIKLAYNENSVRCTIHVAKLLHLTWKLSHQWKVVLELSLTLKLSSSWIYTLTYSCTWSDSHGPIGKLKKRSLWNRVVTIVPIWDTVVK